MEQPRTTSAGGQGVDDATSRGSEPQLAPISSCERIAALDVLRGVAVLGILPINILALALPWEAGLNPQLAGGFSGINFAAWLFCYVLFDQKMMTIFSMLFGAGLVLMSDRMEHRGASPARFFYRRAAVLLGIGLAHAYLLWQGDILVSYALCGMIVYPLRRLPARALLVLGLLVMLPAVWFARAESAHPASGSGTSAAIAEDIRIHREGSYLQLARNRAPSALAIETTMFATTFVWTVSGRMLLGMALMKLGVFSARLSLRFYATLALLGLGLGLPVVGWGAYQLIEKDFDLVAIAGSGEFNNFGSLPVVLGYVGTVLSIYKLGLAGGLMRGLAAVGRLALSNYLMQSLICTTLFYGYGFALFGTLDRAQLLGVVAAIWVWQLAFSTLWLKRFRFGPVEWLWRTLTYGSAQPMRLRP